MKEDATVKRIRSSRHEISEEFGHNTKKFIEYYITYQQKCSDRLIRQRIRTKESIPVK